MKEYTAKKPPCVYCDEGRPHGGGIIRTALIFPGLGVEIQMPYCNWPAGRTAEEITTSIFDANPELEFLVPGVPLRERLIDYLNFGYHRAYC